MDSKIENELRRIVNEEIDKRSKVKIFVQKCNSEVILPEYKHQGDAGMDVRSIEDVIIKPMETKIIKTGLRVAIPEGYEIQVRPRSGLSSKTPLRISNSPGTIDSGYRDEIGLIVTNTSTMNNTLKYTLKEKNNSNGTYIIKKGDRVAQLVLCKYATIDFEPINDNIENIGINRKSGFGKSGVK